MGTGQRCEGAREHEYLAGILQEAKEQLLISEFVGGPFSETDNLRDDSHCWGTRHDRPHNHMASCGCLRASSGQPGAQAIGQAAASQEVASESPRYFSLTTVLLGLHLNDKLSPCRDWFKRGIGLKLSEAGLCAVAFMAVLAELFSGETASGAHASDVNPLVHRDAGRLNYLRGRLETRCRLTLRGAG
jgi:hypothetical protein